MLTSLAKFNPLFDIQISDLSDLFDSVYEPSTTLTAAKFKLDAYERDGKWIIEAALPGVKAEEVSVHASNGLLEITVERKTQNNSNGTNYAIKELYAGSYYRSLKLPRDVCEENVSAELKEGILRLTFEKESKNKIEIKVQ